MIHPILLLFPLVEVQEDREVVLEVQEEVLAVQGEVLPSPIVRLPIKDLWALPNGMVFVKLPGPICAKMASAQIREK